MAAFLCWMISFVLPGREEKSFEVFTVSPDNEFLAFTGRDGSILIVSNKVHYIAFVFCIHG